MGWQPNRSLIGLILSMKNDLDANDMPFLISRETGFSLPFISCWLRISCKLFEDMLVNREHMHVPVRPWDLCIGICVYFAAIIHFI